MSEIGFTTRNEDHSGRPEVNLSGVHVLVVEDTPDSRELLRMVFEFCGADVRTADSAEEAKRLLREKRPDVMVSDIAMPDNGIQLIRAVKAADEAQAIPVIAVTAHHNRRRELLAEGFVDLVEKPIDPVTLCGVVRRYAG